MKKILFLVNHDVAIYNFRREIVEAMIEEGHEVHISSPYGERIDELTEMGAIFHNIEFARHGVNPIEELKIIRKYKKLYKCIKPDIVFGFTVKPNIYGAMAAARLKIPFVANITGLGTAVENPGVLQKITVMLYKLAFRNITRVFFQNEENMRFFRARNIANGKHELLPGSGVNLQRFPLREYPKGEVIRCAFISRIMKEKGIEEYLEAAKEIKRHYSNVEFHVCGFCEEEYNGQLQLLHDKGIVIYHGMITNVAEFMSKMHIIIHPSYYPEGMSNVLLEACSTGRPIITTDRSGCREIVDNNINGYIVLQQNSTDLVNKLETFLQKSYNERKKMGIEARAKVEIEFDRQIVVERYLNEMKNI